MGMFIVDCLFDLCTTHAARSRRHKIRTKITNAKSFVSNMKTAFVNAFTPSFAPVVA